MSETIYSLGINVTFESADQVQAADLADHLAAILMKEPGVVVATAQTPIDHPEDSLYAQTVRDRFGV
jgi:hypothetical protein